VKNSIFYLSVIIFGLIFVPLTNAKLDLKTAAGIWLFDEDDGDIAEDISGNKNHGTIQGAKWAKGKTKSALSFNGLSDRVVVPDSNSLDLQEAWTITAWIFPNKTEANYGHILGKRNDGLNEANYAFRINNVGTAWEAYFKRAGAWQGVWGQGSVKKGEWSYMTATYDGKGIMTLYENGVQIGTGNIGAPPPAGQAEVHIAGWQNNTSELLDGLLDEVVLFGAALQVEDIMELMDNGVEKALGITSVDSLGKLASKWGGIKSLR